MARFGFLLFDDFEDLDLVGPWEIIGVWSKEFGGPEELCLIAEENRLINSTKGLSIPPHYTIAQCPALDYLLIPGGIGRKTQVQNQNLITFIKEQSQHCQQVLSVCTGAFLLHAAGLLAGKKATTHWSALEELKRFSEIQVVDQRFIHDGNIWTSAGISAGIDMALAFVARVAGEAVAAKVQLRAEYYPSDKIYHAKDIQLPKYAGTP